MEQSQPTQVFKKALLYVQWIVAAIYKKEGRKEEVPRLIADAIDDRESKQKGLPRILHVKVETKDYA